MAEGGPTVLGGGRFEIIRALGRGGMGQVWLARDNERGAEVALKTLRDADAAGIYRFKQEFRSLADLSHPNLVVLHELFNEGDGWFFTMERVDGRDFLAHVWGHGRSARPPPAGSPPPLSDALAETRPAARAETPMRDEARLRDAFVQLAEGILALHHAGKLHRDLKPSNVLVTRDGRLVILDFGLVGDRTQDQLHRTIEQEMFGTPAYMSPEQAAGTGTSEPTDWYAVGAMLYEALTGKLPFQSQIFSVIARKQTEDPPPPSSLVSGVPAELERLCMRLLHRDPLLRASGDEVLATLGARPAQPAASLAPSAAGPFIGRARELAVLREAAKATDARERVLVLLSGVSGMGKTTLLDRFLAEHQGKGEAVILRGRCYEGESVPYKAFDSVVDALSRYLRRLSDMDAALLVPRELQALLKVFPVLRRLPAIAGARARGELPPDPQEVQRRALRAFKELMWRMGRILAALCQYAAGIEAVARPVGAQAKLALAERIQAETRSAEGEAFIALARGLSLVLRIQPGGSAALEAAEEMISAQRLRLNFPLPRLRLSLATSYTTAGEVRKLKRRYPEWLRDAEERGELFSRALLRAQCAQYWLARDDPDRARREVDHGLSLWSREEYDFVHMMAFLALVAADKYGGGAAGWRRIAEGAERFLGSRFVFIPRARSTFLGLRVMAALVAARDGREREKLLSSAAGDSHAYLGEFSWVPARWLFLASVAAAQGEREAALVHLDAYETEAGEREEGLARRAVARWRKGELLGGEEGASLVREADRTLRAEGVVNPTRWVAWTAPGFDLLDPSFAGGPAYG